MLLKVLHSYLLYMVLHRMSISSFSRSMEHLHAKRFLKKWIHCFSFLIFWLKENCFYYLGEGEGSITRRNICKKLRRFMRIFFFFFLQFLYKWIPPSFALRYHSRREIFFKYIISCNNLRVELKTYEIRIFILKYKFI